MPETPWAIRTHQLTKQFPARERLAGLLPPQDFASPAVDAVTLSVRTGELFGLLGPNGAGKTTLVKMLATLVAPTSGEALVGGHPLAEAAAIKADLGLVTTDERSFFWRLTGRQNLEFFAALHHLSNVSAQVEELLVLVGLEDAADRHFRTYSTGMRQRLAIARALIHRPRILFLDEPARGLDPPAVRALHHLIRSELTTAQGLTVLLTTHRLQEVEGLCDRVGVLHQGQLRGCGTVGELRSDLGDTAHYRVRLAGPAPDLRIPGADNIPENGVDWTVADDPAALNDFVDHVRRAGAALETIRREDTPLAEIFDRLTEKGELLVANAPEGAWEAAPPPPFAAARPGFRRVAAAFLRRDWQSESSYRLAFLLNLAGIFFSVVVFFFVAQLLGEAAAPALAPYGGDYFAFVLIGIALQRYFGVGLTGFAGALREAQTTGTLEAMLTTPARLSTIVVSASLWRYGQTTLQVAAYLFVGAFFLGVDFIGNYLAALLALLLTIVVFSSLGILAASFIMVLKRGDPITWALSAVSTFFGGVYFPVTLLPDWLEWISAFVPVTYALRAMRLALLQGAGLGVVGLDLLALAAFGVVLFPLSLAAFRYAVRRARLDGSLTHY